MTGKTHLFCGIICGEAIILLSKAVNPIDATLLISCTSLGALFPDIDHPDALISNQSKSSKLFSTIISSVTKHRGITHTPLFALIIWLLPTYLLNHGSQKLLYQAAISLFDFSNQYYQVDPLQMLINGFLYGYISHLVLDTLNEKGIKWFWPLSAKSLHILKIRTGGRVEIFIQYAERVIVTAGTIYILLLLLIQK